MSMRQFLSGAVLLLMALHSSAVERLVSVDGALTEIVYALGAEHRLVGVDTTSRFPEAATELPQVGYMRQLNAEGILALRPTLVIASHDAGPEPVFAQLQAAGVKVARISAPDTLEGVASRIRQVGDVLALNARAEQLAAKVVQAATEELAALPDQSPSTLFLLGTSGRGLMAAGQGTRAQALLELLNVNNAFEHRGYKPISAEGAVQAAPELVLIGHTGSDNSALTASTLAHTPAAEQKRIHTVDVSLVLGFGPRLPQALSLLIPLLYPQDTDIKGTSELSLEPSLNKLAESE